MMYPVMNGCCVVSEIDERDYMGESIISVAYDKMPKKIKELLVSGDWKKQSQIAESKWKQISDFRIDKLVSLKMKTKK